MAGQKMHSLKQDHQKKYVSLNKTPKNPSIFVGIIKTHKLQCNLRHNFISTDLQFKNKNFCVGFCFRTMAFGA